MSKRSTPRSLGVTLGLAMAAGLAATPVAYGQSLVCPQTSSPTTWTGTSLDTGTPTKNGVVFDSASGAKLRLQGAAGLFKSTSLGISDLTVYASVADFDGDGWDDFVGGGESRAFIRIYRNRTFDNPAPDWNDPNAVRTPKFVNVRELQADASSSSVKPLAAADFNGDGWQDVFVMQGANGSVPSSASLWLNKAVNDASGNPQFNASYSPLASGTSLSQLGVQPWSGSSIMALDYNGDRKIDLLIGSGENNGSIRVFLNNCTLASPQPTPAPPADKPLKCSTNPKFTYSSTLISNMSFPASANLPVFSYVDMDGDGLRDLIAGAPSCCTTASQRLRMWKGVSGGGLSSTPQSITFPDGAATIVLAADFSLDGKPDLIVGTDNWNYNSGNGGNAYYWKNSGTGTPFTTATQQLTSTNNPSYDYDVGFVFNYDHDPSNTPDVMMADGNHTASFYVLANRVVNQYVACGDVASGTIDLGTLSGSEMVVTAARIHPTATLNGGTIQYFLSNEEPPNWVLATSCGDATGDLCASFPKPVGRDVRWKATMCSNATHTQTPTLTNIDVKFDYAEAREHFRAGVVINDGVAYAAGFRQPGDRGLLFAINAGLNTTYWNAATAIDAAADSARKIYTSNVTGTSRLDFTTANAANLLDTLQVTDTTQASTVINWVRSARFGVGNLGLPLSRLGAIETSTPAVMTKPGIPLWYVYGSAVDRAKHLQFQTAYAQRKPLVLFGSKDGMIHAIRTTPTAITTSPSGTEAWAFVPPKVASGMISDYTDTLSSGVLTIKSYPDGSPTLADFKKSDGTFATAAIVASGNGGKGMVALDVTNTINMTTNAVIGPTPMWTATVGEAEAGQSYAKPVVARVLIGSAERYLLIAATGIAFDNPAAPWTKGRIVSAYDLATGARLWQFKAKCPVTSDLATFETDDDLEPGAPTLNGYMDRLVFADACGYLYKVDPAKDLGGGYNDNTSLGTIQVDNISGVKQMAMFATATSAGALGAESPITGTIAARSDNTSRVVLFFGTGGLENAPVTNHNAFYAVYADDGTVRSRLDGACTGSRCEKFYGGVVVTPEQVIFTRTTDPQVGTGSCDFGSSTLQAMDINAGSNGAFTQDFSQSIGAAVMGSVYADAGAIYFATLSGAVSRIGTPRAQNAGGDSTATTAPPQYGQGGENSSGSGTIGTNDALTLLGWRQVY